MSAVRIICEGDHVVISGGGMKRIVQVKKGARARFGSCGSADLQTLIGLRFGCVVRLLPKGVHFTPTNDYPDLDITTLNGDNIDLAKDNRELMDNNQSQKLSNSEIAAIRKEGGVDALLDQLVENSATFHTKTTFAQEKYLKKKQKKYGTLFKVDAVTVDQITEIHVPTILPSDNPSELESSGSSAGLKLRVDTVSLILHHSEVHADSRVLMFERTNGLLPSFFLTRLGDNGRIYHVLERNAQPNTFPAKTLQLTNVKARWKAIPKNEGFLLGAETISSTSTNDNTDHNAELEADGTVTRKVESKPMEKEENQTQMDVEEATDSDNFARKRARMEGNELDGIMMDDENEKSKEDYLHTSKIRNSNKTRLGDENKSSNNGGDQGLSQWMKGVDAHHLLRKQPCDSLVIADDKTALPVLQELFPFLAYGGNLVIYSPFLEDMSALFSWLRRDCVMIRVSETWCRHVQVLPQRTHPTVNMSTAGGYLLTAIKINPTNRPGLSRLSPDLFPTSISA